MRYLVVFLLFLGCNKSIITTSNTIVEKDSVTANFTKPDTVSVIQNNDTTITVDNISDDNKVKTHIVYKTKWKTKKQVDIIVDTVKVDVVREKKITKTITVEKPYCNTKYLIGIGVLIGVILIAIMRKILW